jgi:hypothetical protein
MAGTQESRKKGGSMLRFHLCAVCLLALSLSAIAKDNPFAERQFTITPSPVSACELKLDAGQKVIDFDVWPSGGEAEALVRDADGTSKLLAWKLGASAAEVLAVLPANFEAHALALHPASRRIFISGRVGQQWQIVAFEPKGTAWQSHPVYGSQIPIRRLLIGPRPFSIGWDKKSATDIVRYRLFFGVKLGDGIFGIRSVTEEGKREYQVIGPKIALPPPRDHGTFGAARGFSSGRQYPALAGPEGLLSTASLRLRRLGQGCSHQRDQMQWLADLYSQRHCACRMEQGQAGSDDSPRYIEVRASDSL